MEAPPLIAPGSSSSTIDDRPACEVTPCADGAAARWRAGATGGVKTPLFEAKKKTTARTPKTRHGGAKVRSGEELRGAIAGRARTREDDDENFSARARDLATTPDVTVAKRLRALRHGSRSSYSFPLKNRNPFSSTSSSFLAHRGVGWRSLICASIQR